MCCKKFANSQESSWKIIFLHYLRQIGGRLLLSCNFNVKKRPVILPKFYVECLQTFSEHSASVKEQILNLSNSSRSSTVIRNNRHILRDLSEISRGGGGAGNFKFGFGNEVTHPCDGSEIC